MYCMLAGRFPFSDPDRLRLRQKIMFDEVTYPKGISKEAEMIMRKVSIINIKTEALHVLE